MKETPNGLALSCAALIEREGGRTDSTFQNAADLEAACGVSSSAVLGRTAQLPHPYQR
jgi:hypothetical protein